MTYDGKEDTHVDGYLESVLPESLPDNGKSIISAMIYSMIRDAYLVGYETGDGLGYARGRQEGYDMESELAKQFGGKLFRKEVK